jgi:hypothetical protein
MGLKFSLDRKGNVEHNSKIMVQDTQGHTRKNKLDQPKNQRQNIAVWSSGLWRQTFRKKSFSSTLKT